ncbi:MULTISPECIES: sensor histidine kinase [unclassified Paenibacillus]|uniref:sensor histidine kinase n=1 Tax=unclassified Paenibacillus TaxID=185978 RepID=UPI00104A5D42|nr:MULTISPECIES: sensor histidine kinase [unclassified Paenibacillus]NIK68282.1 two-component system sensor histidine kinase YesM [Paenibacillus sp. BK720]TCM99503.1 two-component system sensor histidine kinase YesM [Paenibacillus sp. BK033]
MYRIRSYFHSIRGKLSLVAVICILIPAVLTMLIYNSLTREAVERQAKENATDSMQLVNGSINNLFQGMLNTANYLQANADMKASFIKMLNADLDPYEKFTATSRIMQQLETLTYIGEKSYITIILTNGETFTNYSKDEMDPLTFQKEPWFNNLKQLTGLQSYWVSTSPTIFPYDRISSPYQISVARTLRFDSTRIYGYVIVTMMENKFSKILGSLTGSQEVVLVDGGGKILSSPQLKQVNGQFEYSKQMAERDPRVASSIIKDEDKKLLLTTADLSFNDWHLVATEPYQDAIVNISSIFNRVFLFQIASFIAFLVVLLLLMRQLTKPLIKLGKVASSVQRGNLEVRSSIRGADEIGRLGFLFDQMLDRIKEMITEVSLTQARKRKAELAMLQAQINPHFLFNVLNSIRMKVMRSGDQDSAKMIASLSKLLRMTISRDEDAIMLHEEIELLTHYVELMNLRQKEEARLVVDVDVTSFDIRVPRFILQPLVENALIHGFNQSAGTIRITAARNEHFLELSVADDGIGMDAEQLERLRARLTAAGTGAEEIQETGRSKGPGMSGIGVANVAERMRIMFGDAFHITVDIDQGTRIMMHIPIREEGRPHV